MLDTDGKVTHPLTGTPQGGIVSPILANVYLHYALDLWFHEVVKWHTTGEACLIRYADDFVCAFQNQDEAQHFYGALEHRLSKFGLQLAAAKSRVIPFSRNGEPSATRFDFLGFEFHWGKDRAGKPHLKRRTSRKKLRNSLSNFTQSCKQSRHTPMKKLFASLNLKLRGYYNYYGGVGQQRPIERVLQRGHGDFVEVAQSPESAPQLHAVGFRRFAQSFPCAAATDPSADPSRITAPVFLCRCLTRKRVFLKSPVLEKGTPGSVRGRLGQLAVLPRCRIAGLFHT